MVYQSKIPMFTLMVHTGVSNTDIVAAPLWPHASSTEYWVPSQSEGSTTSASKGIRIT